MKGARIVVLVLPLLGLGALWGQSHRTYNEGTEWDVPIAGYDPRDLLRGHYVEFTYDWPYRGPAADESRNEFLGPPPAALCLVGNPPALEQANRFDRDDLAAFEACAHPLIADPAGVYGFSGLTRGRLYVGQDRARALQRELADPDQRGIVTIRQRDDGTFTPIDIRFRPLTEAEREQRGGDGIRPSAPPIMDNPAFDPNE